MTVQPHINILQEEHLYKLHIRACAIIPYPTVEVKHIWKVYVTNELKIKFFSFFTIRDMIWIFIAVKNRYLTISAVKTENEPKWA